MAAVAYQFYTWLDQEQNNKVYAYLSYMSPTPDSDKERNEPLTIIYNSGKTVQLMVMLSI